MGLLSFPKALIRAFLTLGLILGARISFAGIVFSPHPGYSAPNFFSGTNSRAFYHVHITFPSVHISQVQLMANDQLMATHSFAVIGSPPRAAYRVQDWIGVMFDPSIFEHGADVVIKCRVQVDGAWYEDSYTAVARNHAFLAGLDSHEALGTIVTADATKQGTLAAQTKLQSYYTIYRDISPWNDAAYLLGLVGSNIHLYAGHSTTTRIIDGQHIAWYANHGWDGDNVYFDYDVSPHISVLTSRTSYFDGSPPPFSLGPAYNLVVFESCNAGRDVANTWPYLFPYWNGYGKYLENQAILGCTVFMRVDSYRDFSEQLFGSLVTGHILSKARDDTVEYFVEQTKAIVSDDDVYDRLPRPTDFEIKGDGAMTIRKAYDPSVTDHSAVFWREIDQVTLV